MFETVGIGREYCSTSLVWYRVLFRSHVLNSLVCFRALFSRHEGHEGAMFEIVWFGIEYCLTGMKVMKEPCLK